MSNIITRTITGVFVVAAIFGSIIWHPYAFGGLFLIISAMGLSEFLSLVSGNELRPKKIFALSAGMLIYLLFFLTANKLIPAYFMIAAFPFFLIIILPEILGASPNFKNIISSIFGIVYIILPLGLLNFILFSNSGSWEPLLLLSYFLIVWINDIFAYLTGSFFGRRKLLERVSPKKTWEGCFGGLTFSLAAAWGISYFVPLLTLKQWLALAVITVVTGIIGDLSESLLKRSYNVKDTGSLLPGHGGILDRFDSMLVSVPVVLLYLIFIFR